MLCLLIWESLTNWPLVAALGLALSVAVLWLYPGQIKGSGIGGFGAALLRWAAVVALGLSLLKPVVLRPRSADQSGAVLVLIDCSKSMSVTDPGRTPAERVALAAALGKLPPGARSDLGSALASSLDQLAARAEDVIGAQADVDYARVSGRGIAEKQARLHEMIHRYTAGVHNIAERTALARQGTELSQRLKELEVVPASSPSDGWVGQLRSRIARAHLAAVGFQSVADESLYKSDATVRAVCDGVAKLSRLTLAEQALFGPGSGLIARINPDGPVSVLSIRQGLHPLPFARGGKPLLGTVAADGNDTDLTGALTAALSGPSHGPLRAVVLLSDGRQVGGRRDLISSLHPSGVPVFTVGVAPEHTPDVSITSVILPTTSAFPGETLEGDVLVRRQEDVRPPAELHVTTAAGEQIEHLVERPQRGGRERGDDSVAHFAVPIAPPSGEPAERIVFSVPPEPGEATTENNRVERWIKVSADRLKVAVCTAAPSWDFQYLRGALSRRPWVRLESEILDPERPRLSMTREDILDHDLMILSDLPVDALDVNQWDAINTLVSARGGSVILIAGTNYPLADYARQPIARLLLPFQTFDRAKLSWKQWPGELPAFHFIPTPIGEREALRLREDPDTGSRAWEELPGVYRYLQLPEKDLWPGVQKLLLESSSNAPVLTERKLGAGRVFFLGLNETWRWRLKNGERDADRFWRQLIRYAAGEPYAASNGPISLDIDKVAIAPGEVVHVRARSRGGRSSRDNAASCSLDIVRGSKAISTRLLRATGGGQFAGDVSDLPEGDYRLRLRGTAADGSDVAVQLPLRVAASSEAEMRDISGDPSMLARIARASGGQYLPIEQIDRLPERMAALADSESQYVRHPLWNSPLLFLFVLACFAGEWALRKRLGLA